MDVDGTTTERVTRAKVKVPMQRVPRREKAKENQNPEMESQDKKENQRATQKERAVGSQMVQERAELANQMLHATNAASMGILLVTVGVERDRFRTMVNRMLKLAHPQLWLAHHRLHLRSCLLPLNPIVLQEFSFQMHMAQMFKNMMSWCLIPISEAHAFGGNVRVMQFYIGDEPDAHFASNIGSNMIRTRLESPDEAEMHSILLDSGADTSVFPATMAELGCPSVAPPSLLRDAQGNTIPLHGMRDVEIHLMDMQGRAATIEESVALSDQISQPILCFGRLLESGWSVDGRQQTLTHGSMSIPIEMQQRSMTPRGWIRAVKEEPAILEPLCCIRNVRAEIFNELADLRIGWNLSPEGVGSGKHFANCFQDPMLPCPTMSGRKFRTTLVKHEEQWLVMELCEPLDLIIDLSAEFYGFDGGRLVVTVITTAEHPPHVMGFRLLDDNEDTQPALQVEQRPHADVAAPLAPEDEVAGVDIDVEPHDAGQDIQGQLVVSPERGDHMVVYGVELYRETTLKVERSLCLLQSFTSFTVWIQDTML